MATVHLKLKSTTEIRRISIDKQSPLEALRQSIDQLFQGTGLPVNYSIKYEDEDKDLISVVNESDWREAINFSEGRNGNLIFILGEPIEVIVPQEDEVSKLEKEFIFLSAVDLPQAKDVIDQAISGAKEILDAAKEKIQTIISEDLPKAGNDLQIFLAKQGQNAEEVFNNIQDFVKNAIDEDISKNLEALKQQNPAVSLSAKLVQDVTIPDGSNVNPNTTFTKVWEVNNDGNCAWPVGTQLRPISAIRLSSQPSYEIQSIEAGESLKINVEMVAPVEPGKYRSFYRLFHPETATPFGDIIWVDIVVLQPYKYQEQLNSLVEMGFDESVCRFLLEEHSGNIEECMVELTH